MEMTLSQAADLIGIPQKRLYRAVKAGKLKAEQHHQGNRWEYIVTREDLREFERSVDRPTDEDDRPTEADWSVDRPTDADQAGQRVVSYREPNQTDDHLIRQPPVELYLALVDRIQRAERRTVELELALNQSKRLLSENAESIAESETSAQEARAQLKDVENNKQLEIDRLTLELKAIEEAKQVETERLSLELSSARQEIEEARKPKGIFSWLGLRRKRNGSDASKAVS